MLTQEQHKHRNANGVTAALTNDNTTSASSSTLNANANPPLNTKQPPPIRHVGTTSILGDEGRCAWHGRTSPDGWLSIVALRISHISAK